MESKITVYKNIYEKDKPYYTSLGIIIDRIRTEKDKYMVDLVRSKKTKKEKNEVKKNLLTILFSGEFTTRRNTSCKAHSGYIALDFDNVDVLDTKHMLSQKPYILCAFISPSGNGVKAVANIPKDIDKHEWYFAGLMKEMPQLDISGKNISRACFTSYDKDIYINRGASTFSSFIRPIKKKENKPIFTIDNNKDKAEIAIKIVMRSMDGSKNYELLKASRLAGGYVAGGVLEEDYIRSLLEDAISTRNIDSFEAAKNTIRNGLTYGKRDPLYL